MSDYYEYWFFPNLERDEVAIAKAKVLGALWSNGLIETTNNPELVLSGQDAYGPTAKLAGLYSKPDRLGGVSLTLLTRGMEVCEGFAFKGYELNEIDDLVCPNCQKTQTLDELPIYEVIDVFHESGNIPPMTCPLCNASQDIRAWQSDPKLTFTYLGFAFWNWPPLKGVPADAYNPAGVWSVDIPKLMSEAAGSPIHSSYGCL